MDTATADMLTAARYRDLNSHRLADTANRLDQHIRREVRTYGRLVKPGRFRECLAIANAILTERGLAHWGYYDTPADTPAETPAEIEARRLAYNAMLDELLANVGTAA